MLKLDEKKIRKGKPVGLPYQGSKKKISKKIVEIIKQNFDADKPIYDVFGGGGAITAECVLNGLEVHYNDLDNDITDMFQRVISQDREWIKTLIISRDEFNKIRQKEPKSVDDNLKLLVNSFGNELSSYLYGADWSDTKYDLAVEIINKHDVFSGYKQTETYKKADKPYDEGELEKNKKLTQLEQLQQLGRLQQLEQLQQLGRLQQLEPTNYSYEAFSDIEDAIFYLDPPYENTTQKSYKGDFNSQAFYDWAFGMSKNNIVLISSYDISDERFECVYEFKTARSTMQGGGAGKRTEKLFMAVIT
ncbi:TPA: DNA adenine methylase [Streptococcus pyogenes]|uniref:DNA adenine methylase n=1 Tax=Streptococcus pyogenes TaxID=1314 RepID=UPI002B378BC2|nr:DNA adenine methylase [Streptococcus pyogenes]HER4621784.1 DNA adenine methylase [Streptococcus pyogenes NGAS556]HER4633332.1 DNA adenine methylase [Streptococcus pyogenes NGAS474]HER4643543.1 DNA adenine methylase [Streptococcus pyogenes NGAS508]HER4645334.1 DNA adenine methylase [Streptococcus pyogenes NGAS490]HER4689383.1 DNA adenine methylase [Streptococcus pyogenes NGAS341]HER4810834.1 DNA adenine methylase [Streptococcus pyogenes NGAS071]